METCKRCFREFEESEVDLLDDGPATDLADIPLQDVGVADINNLCHEIDRKKTNMFFTKKAV